MAKTIEQRIRKGGLILSLAETFQPIYPSFSIVFPRNWTAEQRAAYIDALPTLGEIFGGQDNDR